MKIDFENGLPVWVWGILFVLVVLPFSFRRAPEQTQSSQTITTATAESLTVLATPTATFVPAVTDPVSAEIAPAPRPAEE